MEQAETMRRFGVRQPTTSVRADLTRLTDNELVTVARTNPQAFGVLFDRYWETMFRFCYFRLSDWHDAEDVASQIFSNAFTSLDRFHGEDSGESFRAWLYGIARNVLGNTWRYAARHPSTSIDTAVDLTDRQESIEAHVIRREDEELLFTLMAGLPPDQRELLELRLAGLSAGEIATVLNRTPDAIRKAQSRVFAAMRAAAGETATPDGGRRNG